MKYKKLFGYSELNWVILIWQPGPVMRLKLYEEFEALLF